jgi:ADP-ribosylglycohydrolase
LVAATWEARLDQAFADRAAGVLVGQACGDALGVPYEFGPRLGSSEQPQMRGGGLGPYAPAEWSDDTQMAICIAQTAATGADLTAEAALNEIAERFLNWLETGATDVGVHTRAVLSAARRSQGPPATRLQIESDTRHFTTGRTAGNGALMRTAIVGLSAPGERQRTADSALAVARLTHADPLAGDSCILWSEAVRIAVTERRLDLAAGLDLVPPGRRDQWANWIALAERHPPHFFSPNGFTVTALQAAWSAIHSTAIPTDNPHIHLPQALAAAVRAGDDTDTVAAIAGGLLGGYWGCAALPIEWRRAVHGWPGLNAHDLAKLAILSATGGATGSTT